MWQRFTERARRVVFFAQEEAGRLGENYVSTEHLLLGLVRENDSVAARILDRMGVSLGRIRSEIERQVAKGDGRMSQDMQLTPRAKRVIDLAYDEARQLSNNYIGTEHLLLGLIREGEGLAGRVLSKLGVDLERTRLEIINIQNVEPDGDNQRWSSQGQGDDAGSEQNRERMLERIGGMLSRLMISDSEFAKLSPESLTRKLLGFIKADSDELRKVAPRFGDLGTIKSVDERDGVEVAKDAASYLQMLAVFISRDGDGYRQMAEEEAFFFVENGTAVKYLKPPLATLEQADVAERQDGYFVRLMSGPHANRTGWIARNEFAHIGPDDTPFPPPRSEGRPVS